MITFRIRNSVAAFAFVATLAFAPGSLLLGASPETARSPVLTCLDVYPDHLIVATGEYGVRPAAFADQSFDAPAGRSVRPRNDRP